MNERNARLDAQPGANLYRSATVVGFQTVLLILPGSNRGDRQLTLV